MFARLSAVILMFTAGCAAAQERAEAFLDRGFADCRAFNRAVATTEFADEPELFLCHDFNHEPLLIYGFIRFSGKTGFAMTLVTNRHGPCTGTGEAAWNRRQERRHVDASGRFECRDGTQGGLAFGAEEFVEPERVLYAGWAFGGIDGHRTRPNENDRISDDMKVYSKGLAAALGR